MKTIKGALGIDPGRTRRAPMQAQAQNNSQMFSNAAGAQRAQVPVPQRPMLQTGGPMYAPQGQPPMTGGPMFAPQAGAGIGNFMQNQVGAMPQQMQMYGNASRAMPQSVGDMTAQQRNPNYIQGR